MTGLGLRSVTQTGDPQRWQFAWTWGTPQISLHFGSVDHHRIAEERDLPAI